MICWRTWNQVSFACYFPLREMKIFWTLSICLFIILNPYTSNCERSQIKGHLRKLGSHREPLGVTWATKFSTPFVFHRYFVEPAQPVIMKAALDQVDHPGLLNWTDVFLSKKFGSELVKVEQSKIENRAHTASWVPLKDFLNTYQTKDIYLVHSLKDKMKELALIPYTLQCGGFQKVIQESVLWMGSHTASSVLHRDPLDNLLCLLNGRKYVVLIDKAYKDEVEANGFDKQGGFSTVDPQQVDFDQFPRLAHVDWHEANLQKGDCLFIPQGWYHQVTSSGYRHVSNNIWFSHLWWFNKTDCSNDANVHKPLEPISTFGFASPNEAYRSKLLSLFKNQGILHRIAFRDSLPSNPTEERADEFFDAINLFPDGALSWSELYAFDIDKILPRFWDLFDLPENPIQENRKKNDRDDIDMENEGFEDILVSDDKSPITDSDDPHYENVENTISDVEEANDKSTLDEYNNENLPLPDAVSGDVPSLPDDSVDNPVHQSNTHQDETDKEDIDENVGTENLNEFCYDDNCEKETHDAFDQFTESSSRYSDPASDHANFDTLETEEGQKVLKDEL